MAATIHTNIRTDFTKLSPNQVNVCRYSVYFETMTTLEERKAVNRAESMYVVKANLKTLFPDEAMAKQVRSAVDLVQPILMEGSLLANLHMLRCLETADSIAGPLEVSQTFYNRYHSHLLAVVSHLGVRCYDKQHNTCSGGVLHFTITLQWWYAACHTDTAVGMCCFSYFKC